MTLNRLLAALLLTAAAVAQKPPKDYTKGFGTGFNLFSPADERGIGLKYSAELDRRLKFVEERDVQSEVEMIGRRIVSAAGRTDLELRFHVVDTREVNAFAVPGGFLYVNRALIELTGNEAQLAGVIAHEIAHVAGRHATKQISKQLLLLGAVAGASAAVGAKSEKWGKVVAVAGGAGAMLANLRYSRGDEHQADAMAARWMAAAGYDPNELPAFFRQMDSAGAPGKFGRAMVLLSAHPPAADRIRDLGAQIATLAYQPSEPAGGRFQLCKDRLSALPLPPPGQDKTLGSALAALGLGEASEVAGSLAPLGMREQAQTTLELPGKTVWLDTGVRVAKGEAVEVWSEGEIWVKKNSDVPCDPSGLFGSGKGFFKPISGLNTGALIGRVRGEKDSQPFPIGTHRVFRAPAAGQLDLGINDDNNFDNRGAFKVWILTR